MDEHRVREIVREEAQHMRDEDIRRVVRETLVGMGLQPDDPQTAQDQASMIRSLHAMVRTGRKAAVWTIVALFIGAIVEGIRRTFGGG